MKNTASYPLCLHIKTNGIRCKSPALTGRDWCHFHTSLHQTHRGIRRHPAGSAPTHLRALPPLEDRESIQVAISAVFASLAAGLIEPRHAHALFHGLQLAAANVSCLHLTPWSDDILMLDYATTPDGIHLAADSRNSEPMPEPVPEPAPLPISVTTPDSHPDPVQRWLQAQASKLPVAPLDSTPQPPAVPRDPPLIRTCVADRLKVRSPYNFRDDVLARGHARK